MKKTIIALGLTSLLIPGMAAADTSVDELNQEIAQLLEPFQNEHTQAQFVFDNIQTDNERTQKVAVHGLFSKVGDHNSLAFKLTNLSYNYGDGISPTTVLKGEMAVDFTKAIPKNDLNDIMSEFVNNLDVLASDYFKLYGDAFSFKGVTTSSTKNEQGDYTDLSALVTAKIDLDKLPEYTDPDDVMLTELVVAFHLNVKTGLTFDSYAISNPSYIRFNSNERGLKEFLDGLLAKDSHALLQVVQVMEIADNIATTIIESKSYISKLFLIK